MPLPLSLRHYPASTSHAHVPLYTAGTVKRETVDMGTRDAGRVDQARSVPTHSPVTHHLPAVPRELCPSPAITYARTIPRISFPTPSSVHVRGPQAQKPCTSAAIRKLCGRGMDSDGRASVPALPASLQASHVSTLVAHVQPPITTELWHNDGRVYSRRRRHGRARVSFVGTKYAPIASSDELARYRDNHPRYLWRIW